MRSPIGTASSAAFPSEARPLAAARQSTARLAELARRERQAIAEFVQALAEFDRERLWLDLGYSCLFNFLHQELRMSRSAAFFRKTAAELVQRFPEILDPLRDGRLCISSVAALAKVITPENRSEVLPRFFDRSSREAKEIVAELVPVRSPPTRDVVTVVVAAGAEPGPAETAVACPAQTPVARPDETRVARPAETPGPSISVGPAEGVTARTTPSTAPATADPVPGPKEIPSDSLVPSGDPARASCPASTSSSPRELALDPNHVRASSSRRAPDEAEPLTGDLRRLHVTVSRRFLAKLDQARAALSHRFPGANAEQILESALDALLDREGKKKGLTARPLQKSRSAARDHIPARVKREVWKRDQGRCQWELDGGGVCGSRHRTEFDHVVPLARGGASTIDNVRVLCAIHNALAARRVFGDAWMDRFTRRASRAPSGTQGDATPPS